MYKSFHKLLLSAFNNIFQRKTSRVITRSNSQIIPIMQKHSNKTINEIHWPKNLQWITWKDKVVWIFEYIRLKI